MTQTDIRNLAASIHQRLLNKAKASHRPFNELLQYYAIERFLYRLAQSAYRERLILKGALVFTAWGAPLSRPTRDVDLLAYTENAVENLVAIVAEICTQPVESDGLTFDPASIVGEKIKEEEKYEGVRVRFKGYLGNARVNMQIDIGFADVVTPHTEIVEYPTLLDQPRPRLRGYPRETVVAEKVQAMVRLGAINTRMKDFYDLWTLARTFDFEGLLLAEAIQKTFARRDTAIPTELPIALTDDFARDKQDQWQAFIRTGQLADVPHDFASVIGEVREFVWPILLALANNVSIPRHWQPLGPW